MKKIILLVSLLLLNCISFAKNKGIDDLQKEYTTQKDALKKVIVKDLPKKPNLNKKKDIK